MRDRQMCPGLQAVELVQLVRWQQVGHPAVTATQHADEKRAAAVDLFQTDVVGGAVADLTFCHAPAEADVDQMQPPIFAPLPRPGKDDLHQMIPLRVHVAERRGNEDATGFSDGYHQLPFLSVRRPGGA